MAAAAIPKLLVNDLVAQTGQQVYIRTVGDRPAHANLADVYNESGAAGIPLIVIVDLNKLNPNSTERRRKVVEAIDRACESDDGFSLATNHGVPAGVVEAMLRVDGELFRFHFHLPESESERRLKCYSDDPNKAAEARALLAERLLLAISESLGGRWVAVNPLRNAQVIDIGDLLQLQKAIRLSSTSFNVHPHFHQLESLVDQWPSNPPSSLRAACNVSGENIRRAIQWWVHKLGCSSPSYCLPITVNDSSSLHGSETESRPFSPLFILQKNDDVKVEVMITNAEATADEDVSKFDLATIAGTLSLLVPVAINIDQLTTTWTPLWKVPYGIFVIMSLMSALIGLFTASFRAGSRARNLSSHCARMSLVGSSIVFMLLIASKLGCLGCAAGITLVLVMFVFTVLWIRSDKPTGRAAP